ncbi:rod shape-determining protein MreD [Photobacterium angustum]|uniref:rod shape-determining protein MreD n=1 Tax=Photobacterium angustum TaxID=661 RepID=UPI0005E677CD|nr:rod shape-determining protein MreD [Photobacterium angustum]KJF94364.1 rod shape-determining protein MreD [Photobacterium angustum]KJG05337.1 rod shape-determining protein MreD [Photobacterium angustum]PSV90768.1 rod shape-determining protein MreD [Photobacterium angustum]PSW79868.1 rod shape-determining protein MreD [Photobacterium angustum]
MPTNQAHGRIWIWLSFVFALVLQAAPWPGMLEPFRPSWVLLVTCYWVLALPHRVNVGSALIIGLLWDLILGSTLGVRGLMMSVIAYIVALNFRVLRNLSLGQQAIIFALLSLAGKLIEYWAEYLVSNVTFEPQQLWAVVLNFILWPWLFLLLRRIRRKFSIR